jgi:hypothetical protein
MHYVPVDDGWDKELGRNGYITSLYWDIMYTLRLNPSLQMPKIELHRPSTFLTPKLSLAALGTT